MKKVKNIEYQRWIICAFLFLATVLNYMDRQTLSVTAPLIQQELNLNNAQLGLLLSAFFYTYGGMQLVVGLVIDRINARLSYALAVGWWSLAGALTSLVNGFGQLFACRLMLGIGEAANWPAAMRIISRTMSPKERSLANGFFTSGSSIGALITPPLVIWLSMRWGWRSGFLVVGILGFIWALCWLAFYPKEMENNSPDEETENYEPVSGTKLQTTPTGKSLSGWAEILRSRQFWGLVIASAFANPCQYFYASWLPTYLIQERGFSFGMGLGGVLVVPFIGLDVGYLLGGLAVVHLCKRGAEVEASRKLVMKVSMILMLLAIAIPWAETTTSAMVLIFIATLSLASWQSNYLSFVEEVSHNHVAAVSGTIGSAGAFSGALFIWLTGQVSQNTHSFVLIFIALGIMPIIATFGVIVVMGKRTPMMGSTVVVR